MPGMLAPSRYPPRSARVGFTFVTLFAIAGPAHIQSKVAGCCRMLRWQASSPRCTKLYSNSEQMGQSPSDNQEMNTTGSALLLDQALALAYRWMEYALFNLIDDAAMLSLVFC